MFGARRLAIRLEFLQLADPDREIDPFLDQVDERVGHAEIDPERRIAGQELGQGRGDVQAAERHRRAQAEHAARLGLELRDREPGVVDLGQDPLAALVIEPPGLGQAELARGAVEQAHAELVLERADAARHRRGRQAQTARGRGEAAAFDHLGEQAHAGEGVHLEPPYFALDAQILNSMSRLSSLAPRLTS